MEGLRQYWDSPWATFSSGRSRWRNAYLVEYLQKAGITRTKKQVASHIQVLRNMLKGEPEFQLVAGADDLEETNSAGSQGSPSRQASSEDGHDSDQQFPVSPSTPGSTGSFDDFRLPTDSTHSQQGVKREDLSDFLSIGQISSSARRSSPHQPYTPSAIPYPLVPQSRSGSAPQLIPHLTTARLKTGVPQPPSPLGLHSPDGYQLSPVSPTGLVAPAGPLYPTPLSTTMVKAEPSSSPEGAVAALRSSSGPAPTGNQWYTQPRTMPSSPRTAGSNNRLRNLTYWAEGMAPTGLDVDALIASHTASQRYPARTAFRITLTIPALDDAHSPLHGFSAAVNLAAPWAVSATCQTSVHVGSVCKSDEIAELTQPVITDPSSPLMVYLPESALSRCRWLEPVGTTITQKIVVDGETLAIVMYDLARPSPTGGSSPRAELVAFHHWPAAQALTMATSQQPLVPQAQQHHTANYSLASSADSAYTLGASTCSMGSPPAVGSCAFTGSASSAIDANAYSSFCQ